MWRLPHAILRLAFALIHALGYEVFDPADGHDRTDRLDIARAGDGW